MTLLVEYTIKASLIILAGVVAAALLRRRTAAARHWILSVALLAALALPLIGSVVPAWRWSLADSTPIVRDAAPARDARPVEVSVNERIDVRSAPLSASRRFALLDLAPALTIAWAAGATVSLLLLAVGLARLTWLSSRARPVTAGVWPRVLNELVDRYGLRRAVRILHSDHPSLLVTWGALRPSVIVPRVALTWPEERVRVVLGHELAHIRRGDWTIQMVGELLRSIYWFNPVVWLACRSLRQQGEEACDDEVIASGVEGSDYAAHLLDAARALKYDATRWMPAAAIVRSSSLERRVRAMLNADRARKPATRRFRFAAVVSLLATTSLVAAAQIGPATLSGSILDSTGAPIPGAAVTLVSNASSAKFEVQTDERGQFSFVPLPSGDYVLRSTYRGFKAAEAAVSLSGKAVRRDLTLALGTLTESISIVGGPTGGVAGGVKGGVPGGIAGGVQARTEVVERDIERRGYERDLRQCQASPVGGNVRAPRKLRDVKPVYPENLQAAGIAGVVILAATIGTDGTVTTIDVVKSVHPELDAAAIDAVRQWRFDGTLLNCTPTEVSMTVTLNFAVKA